MAKSRDNNATHNRHLLVSTIMNFQQLEYIVALDDHKHFRKAAEHCQVTQPTLSMMIKKLEEELDVSLFDRNKQPIMPTEIGKEVVEKARRILDQLNDVNEVVQQHQGQLFGKVRIGVIPTLAPYLLPLFSQSMIQKYPDLELHVREMRALYIEEALEEDDIDVGILTTPLKNKDLQEMPLFYEKFIAYVARSNHLYDEQKLLPEDIDVNHLWLLEEGDSFRNQVINLCKLKQPVLSKGKFNYGAGCIETLKRFVDQDSGVTILPELALTDMDEQEKQLVRHFSKPEPMREVSLVTYSTYTKKKLVQVLKEEITKVLPDRISLEPSGRVLKVLR